MPVFLIMRLSLFTLIKRGGWKAAVVLSFLSGVIQVALGAVAVSLLNLGAYGGYHWQY
mgnify:CR=1 FL=1